MFSLLIKINEFGVKREHLNTRDTGMCVQSAVMYFLLFLSDFDGEIMLFSSLFNTKSFVLSFRYIKVLLFLFDTCFLVKSRCAISADNAVEVAVLLPAGVPPALYPEFF